MNTIVSRSLSEGFSVLQGLRQVNKVGIPRLVSVGDTGRVKVGRMPGPNVLSLRKEKLSRLFLWSEESTFSHSPTVAFVTLISQIEILWGPSGKDGGMLINLLIPFVRVFCVFFGPSLKSFEFLTYYFRFMFFDV